MDRNSWEDYVGRGSGNPLHEQPVEQIRSATDQGEDAGETFHRNYNELRESDLQNHNSEVFSRVSAFYCSWYGLGILALSVILCLITESLSLEGIFFWNFVLAVVIWVYYEITARAKVRPEWDDVWDDMNQL